MADKVHARLSNSNPGDEEEPNSPTPRRPPPSPDKTIPVPVPPQPTSPPPLPPPPPPGTYVIQIPKDQIYRVPPPENAHRYKHLSKPKSRTPLRCCCRCFCFSLLILLLLLATAAAIFYFVFRPESPNYTLHSLSIKSFNLTSSSSSPISPQVDLTLSAHNPNNKIGIYYIKPISVNLNYHQLNLGNGVIPKFFQPRNNVTQLKTALKASAPLELSASLHDELVAAEKSGKVPFTVVVRAPVRFKVGSVKSWTINVKVKCDVTVDKLTAESKIVSKDCDYSVDVW